MPVDFRQIAAPDLNSASAILARASEGISGGLKTGADTITALGKRRADRNSKSALLRLASAETETDLNKFLANPGIHPGDVNKDLSDGIALARANLVDNAYKKASGRRLDSISGRENAVDARQTAFASVVNEQIARSLQGDVTDAETNAAVADLDARDVQLAKQNIIAGVANAKNQRSTTQGTQIFNEDVPVTKALELGITTPEEAAAAAEAQGYDNAAQIQAYNDFEGSLLNRKIQAGRGNLDKTARDELAKTVYQTKQTVQKLEDSNPVYRVGRKVGSGVARYRKKLDSEDGYDYNQYVVDKQSVLRESGASKSEINHVNSTANTIRQIAEASGIDDPAKIMALTDRYLNGNTKDLDSWYQYFKDGTNAGAQTGALVGIAIGTIAGLPGGPAGVVTAAGAFGAVGTGLGIPAGAAVGILTKLYDEAKHDGRSTGNDLNPAEKVMIAMQARMLDGTDPGFEEINAGIATAEEEGATQERLIRDNNLLRSQGIATPVAEVVDEGTGINVNDTIAGKAANYLLDETNPIGQLAEQVGPISARRFNDYVFGSAITGLTGGAPNDVGLENAPDTDGNTPARTPPTVATSALDVLAKAANRFSDLSSSAVIGLEDGLVAEATRLSGSGKEALTNQDVNKSIKRVVAAIAERENLTANQQDDIINQLKSVLELQILGNR